MNITRTFDVLTLNCFPKGCLVNKEVQLHLATILVPQLEAVGMTCAEWTRGALMFEEPHFSKIKGIVCKKCGICKCSLNPRFESPNTLRDLMNGRYAERVEKGDQLLARLLSKTTKEELKKKGIRCIVFQMPSRKNPRIVFVFTCKDKTHRVSCEIGKQLLQTDEGEETLLSFKQLDQKIEEATNSLI